MVCQAVTFDFRRAHTRRALAAACDCMALAVLRWLCSPSPCLLARNRWALAGLRVASQYPVWVSPICASGAGKSVWLSKPAALCTQGARCVAALCRKPRNASTRRGLCGSPGGDFCRAHTRRALAAAGDCMALAELQWLWSSSPRFLARNWWAWAGLRPW